MFAHFSSCQNLCIITTIDHRIGAVSRRHRAARQNETTQSGLLGHHGIEIQILLHPFPKLERMAVKFGIAGHHIVGAHNRRIAPDIALPR